MFKFIEEQLLVTPRMLGSWPIVLLKMYLRNVCFLMKQKNFMLSIDQ